jgi:predicted SPOUT superfamily RNA methylase MTH1
VVSDTPHLREKTSKVGLIGRAAAIFRVDEIVIFRDDFKNNQQRDMDLISILLTYMETPQYLRKRLFKLEPELQYAGILPPLRTPHHPLNSRMKDLRVGEFREGVSLSRTKEGALVDIGVEQPALILNEQLPVGKRVTVQISQVKDRIVAKHADRQQIPEYWGYRVTAEGQSLLKILESGNFDLTVATSKFGKHFVDVREEMSERMQKATKVLVVFGSPTRGLYDIAKNENWRLDELADFVVNTVPLQGTETVRTEEAIVASLAILNACLRK